jgi:hypothetical protein
MFTLRHIYLNSQRPDIEKRKRAFSGGLVVGAGIKMHRRAWTVDTNATESVKLHRSSLAASGTEQQ